MRVIKRELEDKLLEALQPAKVLLLLGARRIGKTVLLQQIIERLDEPYLLLNGEDLAEAEVLTRRSEVNYRAILGETRHLIIDEAQKIPEIGKILKLMVDTLPGLKVIATGSSSFDMANATGEPLTGRKKTFYLFPLSEAELRQTESAIKKPERLRHRLVYGNYPELLHLPGNTEQAAYLKEMLNAYLLKDILTFESI